MKEHQLWYRVPASCLEEAFPLGNGRMGALVYGQTEEERISLNEETLWSGTSAPNPVPPRAKEAFLQARELAAKGEYRQAQEVLEQEFTASYLQCFLPLGTLLLQFGHKQVSDYRRTLDLRRACAEIRYRCDGTEYVRTTYASAPDRLIVTRLCADREGTLSFTVLPETPLRMTDSAAMDDCLLIEGNCPAFYTGRAPRKEGPYADPGKGIGFAWGIRVIADGGELLEQEGRITVRNATSALILTTAVTDYDRESGRIEPTDLRSEVTALLHTDTDGMEQRHLRDHLALYDRCELSLGDRTEERDTLTRLQTFDGEEGLYELLFHYGRYLMIACSRKGGVPSNLQGIWNESMQPPWNSNYTVNINTEMNYWPCYPVRLEECFEPLERLAKGILRQGKAVARDYYGARGAVSHHNLDLWCHANPVGDRDSGSARYAFWNLSSGWIGCMLYEAWRYHRDREKLSSLIYPYLKEVCRFYLDVLTEDENGALILSPSTSPENAFLFEGQAVAVTRETAMSQTILAELFAAALDCCAQLGIGGAFPEEVRGALARLKRPQINADGRIAEWNGAPQEEDPHHRHVSHLYGLYPGHLFDSETEPELRAAAERSLLARGDDGTGWSLAWKMNLWAMLGDGDHALRMLRMQLRLCEPSRRSDILGGGGSFPNLLGAHPPFQIDSNFGVTAGIANLFLQCREGEVLLFPAKPQEWKKGSIRGLAAYGGVTVDLEWNGEEWRATFTAREDTDLCWRCGTSCGTVRLQAGVPCTVDDKRGG